MRISDWSSDVCSSDLELLDKRMSVDEELKTAQIALEDADRELRDAEKRRSQAEQQSQLIRSQMEQQRMEWQALNVRRKAVKDQLLEDGYALDGVLATLGIGRAHA